MAKAKTVFFCQNCGAQSVKWIGRCPSCGEWNSYVEEVIRHEQRDDRTRGVRAPEPRLIMDIDWSDQQRISTIDQELDRVLGEGWFPVRWY